MVQSDSKLDVEAFVLLGDWTRQFLTVAATVEDVANQSFFVHTL